MRAWADRGLTEAQVERLAGWLDRPIVLEDLSWGLDTRVLHVQAQEQDVIVKAGGAANHHIGREITALEGYGSALADAGKGSRLIAADRAANVLVTQYLRGQLVEGSDGELAAEVHEQAGALLRRFHAQAARLDGVYEARETAKALARLDSQHRIAPANEHQARAILRLYRPPPVTTVPTHGDWQPRNWLVDGGAVKVIDFGRFDFRPPATDLCRLAAQQWRSAPSLEAAFLAGYGPDPRDPDLWATQLLREAVGTAVWAFEVGDAVFEAQGHRMLADALDRF